MSEAMHTPGPWRWDGGILVWDTPSRECIIWPDNAVGDSKDPASHIGASGHNTEPAAAANMALIAAAPDLADALEALVNQLDGMRDFVVPDGGAESLVAARAALRAAGRLT